MPPRYFIPLLLLLAAAPTSKPTTPKWSSLASGEIRYTDPPGWTPIPMTATPDLAIAFKNPDANSLITLHVTPEKDPITQSPALAQSLGRQILKAIKADLANSKADILEEPRLQPDPRFLVRIHAKVRVNGIVSERLHLYRALGYNLVMTIIDVDNQPPADQAKASFTTGENLLNGVVIGKRDRKPPTTRPARKPLSNQ